MYACFRGSAGAAKTGCLDRRSGLGTTTFLRHLAFDSPRIIVYLPGRKMRGRGYGSNPSQADWPSPRRRLSAQFDLGWRTGHLPRWTKWSHSRHVGEHQSLCGELFSRQHSLGYPVNWLAPACDSIRVCPWTAAEHSNCKAIFLLNFFEHHLQVKNLRRETCQGLVNLVIFRVSFSFIAKPGLMFRLTMLQLITLPPAAATDIARNRLSIVISFVAFF